MNEENSLRCERGFWGKAPQARTDFRWLGRSPNLNGVEKVLCTGPDDDREPGYAWYRLPDDRIAALRFYPSIVRDASGRDCLEKQILVAPSGPLLLTLATLFSFLKAHAEEDWYARQAEVDWQNDRNDYVQLPPTELQLESTEVVDEWVKSGLGALGELGIPLLSSLFSAIYQGKPVVIPNIDGPPSFRALLALVAPFPDRFRSCLSLLPSHWAKYESVNHWDVILGARAPEGAPELVPASDAFQAAVKKMLEEENIQVLRDFLEPPLPSAEENNAVVMEIIDNVLPPEPVIRVQPLESPTTLLLQADWKQLCTLLKKNQDNLAWKVAVEENLAVLVQKGNGQTPRHDLNELGAHLGQDQRWSSEQGYKLLEDPFLHARLLEKWNKSPQNTPSVVDDLANWVCYSNDAQAQRCWMVVLIRLPLPFSNVGKKLTSTLPGGLDWVVSEVLRTAYDPNLSDRSFKQPQTQNWSICSGDSVIEKIRKACEARMQADGHMSQDKVQWQENWERLMAAFVILFPTNEMAPPNTTVKLLEYLHLIQDITQLWQIWTPATFQNLVQQTVSLGGDLKPIDTVMALKEVPKEFQQIWKQVRNLDVEKPVYVARTYTLDEPFFGQVQVKTRSVYHKDIESPKYRDIWEFIIKIKPSLNKYLPPQQRLTSDNTDNMSEDSKKAIAPLIEALLNRDCKVEDQMALDFFIYLFTEVGRRRASKTH